MAQARITIEDLWNLKRPAGVSLAPDVARSLLGDRLFHAEEQGRRKPTYFCKKRCFPYNSRLQGSEPLFEVIRAWLDQPGVQSMHQLENIMRVDFCTFTFATDGETPVRVNPQQVRCFYSTDGDNTTIVFDDEHSITVTAPPSSVEKGLSIDSE